MKSLRRWESGLNPEYDLKECLAIICEQKPFLLETLKQPENIILNMFYFNNKKAYFEYVILEVYKYGDRCTI